MNSPFLGNDGEMTSSLAIYRYRLPYIHPLRFGTRQYDAREGLLLRIGDGWGEIAPLPGFSKETLEEAIDEAQAACTALAAGQQSDPTWPSVQFGFDCAQRQWPRSPPTLPRSYPLLQGSPADLLRRWREESPSGCLGRADPRTVGKLKLKVARHPAREELDLIRFLKANLPGVRLILDANQGWQPDAALAFCRELDPAHIEYLEEPCSSFAATAAVARATGIGIALDEILAQGQPWEPVPELRALIIKPTLIGSLHRCTQLVDQARQAGLQVVVSSSYESGLGLGQLRHLAAEWAPGQAPGLDTARALAADLLDLRGRPDTASLQCLGVFSPQIPGVAADGS